MLTPQQLQDVVNDRLSDAQVLLDGGRYDGAQYIAGYAVEIALKRRICLHLNWPSFPHSTSEFKNVTSLKTHDLPILLRFTGLEAALAGNFDWLAVLNWSPENRYLPAGASTVASATVMLGAVRAVVAAL